MQFTDITTWSVSKGMATPVNPHLISEKGDFSIVSVNELEKYVAFQTFAKQHTYASDAPDGSYPADCFGEIVWQIQNPMTSQWVNTLDNKPNKEYSNRLFLQFKQLDNSILLKDLIIKIDAMTTKEFCDIFNYEPPSWKGDVKLAAVEFAYIDAMKWNIIKNKSKEPESPKFGEWISVDPDAAIEDTELQSFEEYFIVIARNGQVRQATFCKWYMDEIYNVWIMNGRGYPLTFATHYQRVIYPAPPKTI